MDEPGRKYFLSHAGPDKDFVREVGVQVQVIGGEVFFDEWSIDYGESIPGAIDAALANFDVFVLFWSAAAAKSAWTEREYRSAIHASLDDPTRRVVLIRLDETIPPPLLRDLKWFDARERSVALAVRAIMQVKSDAERMRALQQWLESLGDIAYNPGYGAAVACPSCGAPATALESWSAIDEARDDEYAGLRCTACGWNDGGEI